MTSGTVIKRVCWGTAFVASLVVAYLGGTRVSDDSGTEDRSASGVVSRQDPLRRSERREEWHASTAASRTLDLIDRLDRCEAPEDFGRLIEEVEWNADKSERQRFLSLVFSGWLEQDPISALSEVRRVERLRHDAARVSGVFMQWAMNDPAAAADLLRLALDGRQGDPDSAPPFLDGVDPPEFLLSVVAGLGLSDPELAAATLTGAGDSPVRTAAVEVLLQDWHASDPDEVRNWAVSIEDPETRRLALSVAGTEAGQVDELAGGLAWAMALPDENDQQVALEALTGQWSQRRAADAFAWVSKLPDDDLKFGLMPAVLRQLAIIDPGAAADWLNQYDAGPEMDASVAAYARGIRHVNPPAALGSAQAITDPRLRESVVASIRRVQAQSEDRIPEKAQPEKP